MPNETSRRYLFVSIYRAPRRVFIRIYKSKTAANARRFLRDLNRACPMAIHRVLTENGKEFTDRLFDLRKRAVTGKNEFNRLCAELEITLHRYIWLYNQELPQLVLESKPIALYTSFKSLYKSISFPTLLFLISNCFKRLL